MEHAAPPEEPMVALISNVKCGVLECHILELLQWTHFDDRGGWLGLEHHFLLREGLMHFCALAAGLRTVLIFISPGRTNSPTAFFFMCDSMTSIRLSRMLEELLSSSRRGGHGF